MGLFDFFKRRQERESAIPPPSAEAGAAGAQADQPVVGQQFSGQVTAPSSIDVSSLGGLAGLAEAMKVAASQGNAEVTQSSQTLDLRGTGLREEIVEIMKRHGVDPESGAMQGTQFDASSMPAMQAEMLEALKRHGIDTGSGGIQIDSSQPPEQGQ